MKSTDLNGSTAVVFGMLFMVILSFLCIAYPTIIKIVVGIKAGMQLSDMFFKAAKELGGKFEFKFEMAS